MTFGNNIVNMMGDILKDEVDCSPYFLSKINYRRYYRDALGFVGSEEDFRKACEECPPDSEESYTQMSNLWKPTFFTNYVVSKEFRKTEQEKCALEEERCMLEELKLRTEKDIA